MALRKALLFISPLICSASLATGFAMAGQGTVFTIGLLAYLAWLLSCIRPATLPPGIPLALSVGIAVAGASAWAPALPMIVGATFALASWDLILFNQSLAGKSNSSSETVSKYEHRHLQNLLLILVLGLSATLAGRMISATIPFAGMILLACIALFSLDLVLRILLDMRAKKTIELPFFHEG
jgi:hypothetical protein